MIRMRVLCVIITKQPTYLLVDYYCSSRVLKSFGQLKAESIALSNFDRFDVKHLRLIDYHDVCLASADEETG